MPPFIDTVIQLTGLCKESRFLDLGCGIGQAVIQASLRTGCWSRGVDDMEPRVNLACNLLEQAELRRMHFGIRPEFPALDVKFHVGDMLGEGIVREWISVADVIFINDLAFDEKCLYFLSMFINNLLTFSQYVKP